MKRDPLSQEQYNLIISHVDFTKSYTYGIIKTWPLYEWEDAMGDGMVGLVEAAYNFDPSLGHKFATYASHRIRREVLDGIRSRNGRRSQKTGKYQFVPEKTASLHALGSISLYDDDELGNMDHQVILGVEERYEEIEERYLRKDLAAAIDKLDDRSKMVLTLYFFEGMSMKAIGEVYDLTESRVCQIVRYLRERLNRIFIDAA